MRAFLFEKYGYYPDKIENGHFEFKGWIFHLVETEMDEKSLFELEQILSELNEKFEGRSSYIVHNRFNELSSFDGEQNYVLWAIQKSKVGYDDLLKMHEIYRNYNSKEQIKISDILLLWEDKFDFVESKIIPSLRSDDAEYYSILEGIYFAFGLAENALQYLADTRLDYGNIITSHTLVHKRLSSLTYDVFFDPFNLILDNPIRDLAELYKSGNITTDHFAMLLQYYDFNQQEASLLMARILFPTKLFDVLERHYIDRVDIKKEILNYRISNEMELTRLKNVHLLLVKKYSIRPLNWLWH